MASAETSSAVEVLEHMQHSAVVEMAAAPAETSDGECVGPPPPTHDGSSNEITPLLPTQNDKQHVKINIFSRPYTRRKPREQLMRLIEPEPSVLPQLISLIWGGCRYSGMMCMGLASTVYYIIGAVSETFTAQPIPLFETVCTRCTVILILSFLWLRRSGQPIFGPAQARRLLVLRAISGNISVLSFVYCIQRLPLSQSIILSFTAPILASVMAKSILHEKLNIADVGGLASSFFGVLFIFQPIFASQGDLTKLGSDSSMIYYSGSHHFYLILLCLLSSITAGLSYCLTRAGAKASDSPICTVFYFGILAIPASAICTYFLEEFVLPSLYSVILMILLGLLSFTAQALLARGLHLETTSKVLNLLYIEVAFAELWGIAASTVSPSFGRLVGCLLILVSVSCTVYSGPEKETE